MKYVSVAKMAEKWGISERSVRNYCAHGRIADAKLIGKTWYIPEDAQKPERVNKKNDAPTLLQILREQKAAKMTGGIYHKVQIDLTYNSNHIEEKNPAPDKETDAMTWVRHMNMLKAMAEEVVVREVIYT